MKIEVYYLIKKMEYIRNKIIYLQKINNDGLLNNKIKSYYRIYEMLIKKMVGLTKDE